MHPFINVSQSMFHHVELTNRKLKSLIDNGTIRFGGNKSLKIYGTLSCTPGKRMKKESRVFFKSEEEAIDKGYRPCGHCMREEYQNWKEKSNQSHT
jgi:methylphosphotriester-DNA--protein-cysteine methyltransferase